MFLKLAISLKIILCFYISNAEISETKNLADNVYFGEQVFDENGDYIIDDMVMSRKQYNSWDFNRYAKWPKKTLVYKFQSTFQPSHKIGFEQCIKDIRENTCIEFVERTTQSNYVFIKNATSKKSCTSFVGYQNSVQNLIASSLNDCINYGKICHEILHALGFVHEHCSPNRNKYVYVNYTNLRRKNYLPFRIEPRYSSYGVPYCFESIMHYKPKSFSKNGEDTILVKEPYKSEGRTIGNRDKIADCDIQRLNKLYNCPPKTKLN